MTTKTKFSIMLLEEKMNQINAQNKNSALSTETQTHIQICALLEMAMTGSAEYVQSRYDEIMSLPVVK